MDAKTLKAMFDAPSINAWHALSHEEFAQFVAYVFQRAGHEVQPYKEHGADLVVAESNRQHALVTVQSRVGNVGLGPISTFAALKSEIRGHRYYITTGDFASTVESRANLPAKVKLVNGPRLKRYIDYISGIRFEDSKAPPTKLLSLFEADDVCHEIGKPTTQVIVVANNKGGVGKTTTALNLCYGLARRGKKVLAVDFDPQSNLTLALLRDGNEPKLHMGHHLEDQRKLGELVRLSQFENIFIIPSHESMRLAFVEMSKWEDKELNFFQQLLSTDVTRHPEIGSVGLDWIVIDTPPDMGLFTRCALAASNYVLIPIAPELASSTGTKNIIETVQAIAAFIGDETRVQLLGAFFTKYDTTQKTQERVNLLKGEFLASSLPILQSVIHDDSNVKRGFDESIRKTQQRAIDLFAREGHAGDDYQQLLKEILDHVSYP